ncbi:MAG: type 4a pilus biogenesis protein PilO [Acidobacteria bacterium]|nr:type 4a pilus biogenesis protein PilO [Acidobacteriota bacterium]
MTSPTTFRFAWRERLWLWLPALLFLAVNIGFFAYYQLSGIGDEVGILERRLASTHNTEKQLAKERQQLESLLADVELNRQRVADLYGKRLSTQEERLTAILAEVRRLATRAGLAPSAVSYPQETIEDFGLLQTSFVFNVEGSYADLRRFINSLELTPSFLTLERIGLSEDGSSGARLKISLRLSTLFADEDSEILGDELPPLAEEAGT